MRGLIITRGMCFRNGTRGTLNYGDETTITSQKEATLSHRKLYHHLKNKYNLELTFHLDSPSTNYDHLLKEWLSDCNVNFNFVEEKDPSQLQNFNRIIKHFGTKIWFYDFIIILRNDIFLKDLFIESIIPNDNVLRYPFVLWYRDRKVRFNLPKISETLFFFPRRYFRLFEAFTEDVGHFHEVLVQMKQLDTMLEHSPYINTYHDADSYYDFNPLYRMVSREETLTTETHPDLKYPDHF
jgi:hypothetical protein